MSNFERKYSPGYCHLICICNGSHSSFKLSNTFNPNCNYCYLQMGLCLRSEEWMLIRFAFPCWIGLQYRDSQMLAFTSRYNFILTLRYNYHYNCENHPEIVSVCSSNTLISCIHHVPITYIHLSVLKHLCISLIVLNLHGRFAFKRAIARIPCYLFSTGRQVCCSLEFQSHSYFANWIDIRFLMSNRKSAMEMFWKCWTLLTLTENSSWKPVKHQEILLPGKSKVGRFGHNFLTTAKNICKGVGKKHTCTRFGLGFWRPLAVCSAGYQLNIIIFFKGIFPRFVFGSIVCYVGRLVVWLLTLYNWWIDGMVFKLPDRWIGLLIDWYLHVHWLVDWLVCWLNNWLLGLLPLSGCLIDRSFDWLVHSSNCTPSLLSVLLVFYFHFPTSLLRWPTGKGQLQFRYQWLVFLFVLR